MQLGDTSDKNKTENSIDSSSNKIVDGSLSTKDGTESKSTSTVQPSNKQNILSPTDAVNSASDVSQNPSLAGSAEQKKPKRIAKIIFSILIVLAVVMFGIAVSMYLIRLGNNPLSDKLDKSDSAPKRLDLNSGTDQNSVIVADTNNPDGFNLQSINQLNDAIQSYYQNYGVYPWEDYGDKPIPIMNKILNPASEPNYAWLVTEPGEENKFANQLDIDQIFSGDNAKELRIYGFASWYAICFTPTTEEYISKASYTMHAESVQEGTGEYVCVRGDIVLKEDSGQNAPSESTTPSSVFGNL